jgi:hypothetical protein
MTDEDIGQRLDNAVNREFPGGVPWREDAQREKAIEAVKLVAKLVAKPSGALRLHQATLASQEDPRASERASVKAVLDVLRPKLPVLAGGADRVGIVRLVAVVATAGLSNGVGARLAGHGSVEGSKAKNIPALKQLSDVPEMGNYIVAKAKALIESYGSATIPGQEYPRGGQWDPTPVNKAIDKTLLPAIHATAVRAESGLHRAEQALEALDATRRNHQAVLESIISALGSSTLEHEVDALWWSQALWSPSANVSYRDLADESPAGLLPIMATDLLKVLGHEPNPSGTSLYVETARRLLPDLDLLRPWQDWMGVLLPRTAGAMPGPFGTFAKEDATGLPVSAWILGGEDPTRASGDEAPVRGREIARRYFRERQVAAFFAAAKSV